jgi:hypothetical protein
MARNRKGQNGFSAMYPAFLVFLFVTGNIGGMETTGEIGQIEVTENSLFY